MSRKVEGVPLGVPLARAAMAADRPDIRFGRVMVSFARRQVTVDGVQVHLSRREYDLLAALLVPARDREDPGRIDRPALAGKRVDRQPNP